MELLGRDLHDFGHRADLQRERLGDLGGNVQPQATDLGSLEAFRESCDVVLARRHVRHPVGAVDPGFRRGLHAVLRVDDQNLSARNDRPCRVGHRTRDRARGDLPPRYAWKQNQGCQNCCNARHCAVGVGRDLVCVEGNHANPNRSLAMACAKCARPSLGQSGRTTARTCPYKAASLNRRDVANPPKTLAQREPGCQRLPAPR